MNPSVVLACLPTPLSQIVFRLALPKHARSPCAVCSSHYYIFVLLCSHAFLPTAPILSLSTTSTRNHSCFHPQTFHPPLEAHQRCMMDYFGIQVATGFVRYLGSNTPALPLRDMGIRTDKAVLRGLCLFYRHGYPRD